jgi:GT2 family glycosyltransferase
MAGNWNRAIELASAEFVKLLCDDDLVEPDCIEMQVAAMDRHPGVSLVTCSRKILSATGKVLFIRRSFRRDGVYPGRAVIARCIRGGTNLIGEPSAVLLRRATLERAGRFRESVVYYTDLDLWLRVLMHGDLYFIAAPKASFRIHVQSATRGAEGKMLADYFRVADAICGATQTELTCLQRFWLSWKVRSLNAARRAIYNRLAQR